MTRELRTALEQQLNATRVPPGDLDRAIREGNRRRRSRRAAGVVVAGAAVVAVGFAAARLGAPEVNTEVIDPASLGPLDFSDGLRAYADPGGSIFLGGREFPAAELQYLDTDATATPYGVVFYDRGRPMLLAESGDFRPLVDGPVEFHDGFHPTAKADSTAPLVAWATLRDGIATMAVHDMARDDEVDALEVDCGDCDDLVIDALDDGVVLFRTGDETRIWRVGEEQSASFAGGGTRVADLRTASYCTTDRHPPRRCRPVPARCGAGRRPAHLRRALRPQLVEPAAAHAPERRPDPARGRPDEGPGLLDHRHRRLGPGGGAQWKVPGLHGARLPGPLRDVHGARAPDADRRRPDVHRQRHVKHARSLRRGAPVPRRR